MANDNNNNNKAYAYGRQGCFLDIAQVDRNPEPFVIKDKSVFSKEQWQQFVGYEGPFPRLADFYYFGPFHRQDEQAYVIGAPSKYPAYDPDTGETVAAGQPTGYRSMTDGNYLKSSDLEILDQEEEYAPVLRGDPINRDGRLSYEVDERDYLFSYGVLQRYKLFKDRGGIYSDRDVPLVTNSDGNLVSIGKYLKTKRDTELHFFQQSPMYTTTSPYRPPRTADANV